MKFPYDKQIKHLTVQGRWSPPTTSTYVQDGVKVSYLDLLLQPGQGLGVLVAQVSIQGEAGREAGFIDGFKPEHVAPAHVAATVVLWEKNNTETGTL